MKRMLFAGPTSAIGEGRNSGKPGNSLLHPLLCALSDCSIISWLCPHPNPELSRSRIPDRSALQRKTGPDRLAHFPEAGSLHGIDDIFSLPIAYGAVCCDLTTPVVLAPEP